LGPLLLGFLLLLRKVISFIKLDLEICILEGLGLCGFPGFFFLQFLNLLLMGLLSLILFLHLIKLGLL